MKPAGRIELPERMRDAPTTRLFAALDAAGIAARFVGGSVRDSILGKEVDNFDLAVTAPPDRVMAALETAKIKAIPTGIKHGTVTGVADGRVYELTTLRRDVETDGRRAVVAFTDDWLVDAERRDFTFNALYADRDGTLYDPFAGRADLAAGKVRFIGDPEQRIAEDRLRVLRFFRFHAWYGNPPFDEAGLEACKRNAASLTGLSGERVSKELQKLLLGPGAADAMDVMREAGVLDHWLSEYGGSRTLRELIRREHKVPEGPCAIRRLASVLARGSDATKIGKRLKLSTQEALRLGLMLEPEPPVGIHPRAEIYELGTTTFTDRVLLTAPKHWHELLELERRWSAPELPVSGADALKLGLKPGPQVGALIDAVERWWIAGDFAADRTACLAELKRLASLSS